MAVIRREKMPRQARLDTPGTLHHIILRGSEQRAIVQMRKIDASLWSAEGGRRASARLPSMRWRTLGAIIVLGTSSRIATNPSSGRF